MPTTKLSPPMDTDTVETLVKKSIELVPTESGNSHYLTASPQSRPWNVMTDLFIKDLFHAVPVMRAIARWASDAVQGNSKFFLVAPAEKLSRENGTGRMAYVRYDYTPQDTIIVNVNGTKVNLSVDPRDIPPAGYRCLNLVAGQLIGQSDLPYFTARGLEGGYSDKYDMAVPEQAAKKNSTYVFWSSMAFSALLDGYNVSVSIGPRLLEEAERIIAVCDSPDIEAALGTYRFANREMGREYRAATEEVLVIRESEPIAASDASYAVKNVAGETVSLKGWNPKVGIPVVTSAGVNMNLKVLQFAEWGRQSQIGEVILDQRLRAHIRNMNKFGYKLDLSRLTS